MNGTVLITVGLLDWGVVGGLVDGTGYIIASLSVTALLVLSMAAVLLGVTFMLDMLFAIDFLAMRRRLFWVSV